MGASHPSRLRQLGAGSGPKWRSGSGLAKRLRLKRSDIIWSVQGPRTLITVLPTARILGITRADCQPLSRRCYTLLLQRRQLTQCGCTASARAILWKGLYLSSQRRQSWQRLDSDRAPWNHSSRIVASNAPPLFSLLQDAGIFLHVPLYIRYLVG